MKALVYKPTEKVLLFNCLRTSEATENIDYFYNNQYKFNRSVNNKSFDQMIYDIINGNFSSYFYERNEIPLRFNLSDIDIVDINRAEGTIALRISD